MRDAFVKIKSRNSKCLECGTVLESHESNFCNQCAGDQSINGGVDMFDFNGEASYELNFGG